MTTRSGMLLTALTIGLTLAAPPPAHAQPGKRPVPRAPAQNAARPNPNQPAAAVQLNANVQETLLGPNSTPLWVSDDGGHVAVAGTKDSHAVMIVDGVEGQPYDAIGPSAQFSPDGRRFVYVARRGASFFAVVDGKENPLAGGQVPGAGPAEHALSHPNLVSSLFHFTRDGVHLAYPASGSDFSGHMIVDGAPGPPLVAVDLDQFLWAGNRLVYVANTKDLKWHLVIDNKMGQAYDSVRFLRATPDGAHVAYTANNALIKDGENLGPVFVGSGDPYRMEPDGRIAYMRAPAAIVVEGHSLAVSHRSIVFNPGGKGFAYTKGDGGGSMLAVIDGKEGQKYETVGQLQYSRDGKRSAFVGSQGGLSFLVIDGVEQPGQKNIGQFRFSDDGKHYMYTTLKPGGYTVVFDDKPDPTLPGFLNDTMQFSPDGRRHAYVACPGQQCQVVLDGVPSANSFFFSAFQSSTSPRLPFPRLLFSPDSSRIAYCVTQPGTSASKVVVGDETWPSANGFGFPVFSPDGRHFAAVAWRRDHVNVMVDGKDGPSLDGLVETSAATFQFVDNRTLRLLGVKQGQIYRILVTLAE